MTPRPLLPLTLVVLLAGFAAHAATPLFAGSVSLDYRLVSGPTPPPSPSPFGITGLTVEAAQKVVVELGHGVGFTVKACGGCHGLEVDQAFGEVRVVDAFNVRVGRINVPFGEFNLRHDPVNFTTPSKPLPFAMGDMLEYGPLGFNLGIVPAPYVETGAEVFGTLSLGDTVNLDYSVYGVKGLTGSNDLDFALSRLWFDRNKLPAFGGRFTLSGDGWTFGASGTAGTYDVTDTRWYVMGGVDGYLRLGPVTLRAEGLFRRTDLDASAPGYPFQVVDPWILKAGWYAQADVTFGARVTLALRSDGIHRFGPPVPGSPLDPQASVLRQTAALMVRPHEHFAIKLDYELWSFVGTPFPTRHVGRLALVLGY